MKIAVIMVGYQCLNINSVLAPWFSAKFGLKGFTKPIKDVQFYFSATTALFKERSELGEVYNNEQTENYLKCAKESGSIDFLNVVKEPILDFESRVAAWNSVRHLDVDYVWQLDLFDEYYTYDEIKNTCNWLKENSLYDFYRINFKNYFGKPEDKTYVLDFKPVRIINNRKNGGVDNFYFDNDIIFKNGQKTPYCAGSQIPQKMCNPRHLSWVGDKEFLKNKIEYQRKALPSSMCSYNWNEEEKKLEFNKNYYYKYNIPIPIVYNDLL